MSDALYYVITSVLTVFVLVGIAMMSKVKIAARGNQLSAVAMLFAILVTLYRYELFTDVGLYAAIAVGTVLGVWCTLRVKMIQMPQMVALLNGFGGAASMIVGAMETINPSIHSAFSSLAAGLAMAIGMLTLTGSLVAAAKLQGLMGQKPVVWKGHALLTMGSIVLTFASIALLALSQPVTAWMIVCLLMSGFFGVAFAVRVGGADMPITISLLNSFSGVAAGIAGIAIADPLLVAIGGIVGSSGLLLTQIMCKAMNRHLMDILLGKTSMPQAKPQIQTKDEGPISADDIENLAAVLKGVVSSIKEPKEHIEKDSLLEALDVATGALNVAENAIDPIARLRAAKSVIIVPGYGMALAQAQALVKQLADVLESFGADVRYAIHPVAGRMPGHMNVLLAEVDVPYDQLYEMDDINPQFPSCDVCIVIGANDVVNPAANTAEGTPIYGMPILDVASARHLILCNFDTKPGYAGVDNPLYTRLVNTTLLLGDAKESLENLLAGL